MRIANDDTLLGLCIINVADHIGYTATYDLNAVPLELVERIYSHYSHLTTHRRAFQQHQPKAHLAALHQFATCWTPAAVIIHLPHDLFGEALDELKVVANFLKHLQLNGRCSVSSLLNLTVLLNLTCLSLRGCVGLQQQALPELLKGLPQLQALDLSGLPAVTDSLAPALSALQHLLVLQINNTACSDVLVEYLSYGQRLHAWQIQHGGAASERAAQLQGMQLEAGQRYIHVRRHAADTGQASQWPRTKVRQWHLAHTHVTARTAELLMCLEQLTFLDMRGTAIQASQLLPLKIRFALSAIQGAVLSRSAAVAAAAVAADLFVCGAGSGDGTSRHTMYIEDDWMQEGVNELVHASDEVLKMEAEQAAKAAETSAAMAGTRPVLSHAAVLGSLQPGVYPLNPSPRTAWRPWQQQEAIQAPPVPWDPHAFTAGGLPCMPPGYLVQHSHQYQQQRQQQGDLQHLYRPPA